MLPNPYTPGQPAQVLGGRVRERGRIAQRLDRVAALGDYAGPLLVFHAARGIGKTSLLRAGQQAAAAEKFVTVWVSATASANLVAEVWHATDAALAQASFLGPDRTAQWRSRLTGLEVQLGVPGAANVTATVDTSPHAAESAAAPRVSAAEAPVSALEQMLHQAAVTIRENGGAGLALFVDEVHAAQPRDLGVLLNALQNLDGARIDNPMAAVFAGLPASPEAITAAATFGERSQFVALDRLDDEDSAVALVKPAQDSGVAWAREALAQVVADAAGYPYFVQLLGSTTWDVAEPGPGSTLTMEHVRAGYTEALHQLLALFRARWKAASKVDQLFIVAMVEDMLVTGAEDVERATVARRMSRPSSALGVPRTRLIEKGIVEPSGHGALRFTIPGFAAYVAAEHGLAGADRLRELTGFPGLGSGDARVDPGR